MPEENQCPTCGATLAPQVVICTKCGTNIKTGEQFGTKVDKKLVRKGRRKQSLLANATFLCAAAVLVLAGVVLNHFRAKHEQELREAMAEVNSRIQQAEEQIKKKSFDEAFDRFESSREALDAYREIAGKNKRYLAVADKKEKEIAALENDAAAKKKEQERRDREARRIADMKRKGYEEFQGKMMLPRDIRAKGYIKVDGKWIHHDVLVRERGWKYHRGKYRSPEEMRRLGYDVFEGVWRDNKYIKQAQEFVEKDDEWLSWDEMLRRQPVKVTIPKSKKVYIGELKENSEKQVAILAHVVEPDPKRVRVKAERARLLRPRGRRHGPEEGPGAEEDRPILLTRGRELEVLKRDVRRHGYIVHVPGRGPEASGFISSRDVEAVMVRQLKLVKWSKLMFHPVITDISGAYRDAVREMRSSDPRALRKAAAFWAKEADPEVWPNARWMAVRCLDLVKLYESGRGRLRGKLGGLPVGATAPRVSAPRKAAKGRRVLPIRAAAGPSQGDLAVVRSNKTVIKWVGHGGKFEDGPASKGQAFTVVGMGSKLKTVRGQRTVRFFYIKGTFKGQKRFGWMPSEDVDVTLTVKVGSADILSGTKKIGTLKRGDRVRFEGVSKSGAYVRVAKTADGRTIRGYVIKSAFFPKK